MGLSGGNYSSLHISCTGNECGVPHSSPVFGLEWDTQHSTTPQYVGLSGCSLFIEEPEPD
jgi:hypothetical protein